MIHFEHFNIICCFKPHISDRNSLFTRFTQVISAICRILFNSIPGLFIIFNCKFYFAVLFKILTHKILCPRIDNFYTGYLFCVIKYLSLVMRNSEQFCLYPKICIIRCFSGNISTIAFTIINIWTIPCQVHKMP